MLLYTVRVEDVKSSENLRLSVFGLSGITFSFYPHPIPLVTHNHLLTETTSPSLELPGVTYFLA